MRTRIVTRLERLEAKPRLNQPTVIRYGWITRLPKDFIGERHGAEFNITPCGNPRPGYPRFEWCQFEERAGPAPQDLDRDGAAAGAIPQRKRMGNGRVREHQGAKGI
jgi:hypothetical protein